MWTLMSEPLLRSEKPIGRPFAEILWSCGRRTTGLTNPIARSSTRNISRSQACVDEYVRGVRVSGHLAYAFLWPRRPVLSFARSDLLRSRVQSRCATGATGCSVQTRFTSPAHAHSPMVIELTASRLPSLVFHRCPAAHRVSGPVPQSSRPHRREARNDRFRSWP